MKKIVITSAEFEGSIEVCYANVGTSEVAELVRLDFGKAVMPQNKKRYLLTRAPLVYGQGWELEWGLEPGRLVFSTGDFFMDFEEDFYGVCQKKVNRARALKEWNKLTKEEQGMAVFKYNSYLRYLNRTGVAHADPENYLRKKYFLNDYEKL